MGLIRFMRGFGMLGRTAVDLTTAERDRVKALERENRQLRQANDILKKASVRSTVQRNRVKLSLL
jgi:transposase-like protein